jgi:hypothetical protein
VSWDKQRGQLESLAKGLSKKALLTGTNQELVQQANS